MGDISPEIKKLLHKYNGDTKLILKEEPRLEYLYALSDMRENVLEWYEFRPDASLLSVGSDYGALTGLFGRRVREVTVLDKNPDNLEVNRLRHGAGGNIRYEIGSLDTFTGEFYDYVVMVGTLEKPYEDQIRKAKALLKPDGRLIVTVCNRLGLKYQAGAMPDRNCLTKSELTELLCGEKEDCRGVCTFYYPMPDYRLPMTIYSDGYLPAKGDLSHAIMAYDYPVYLRFDLGKRYDDICGEKQFETFANSFLVIWSAHEED